MPCAPRKSFTPKSPVKRPAAAAARAFAGRRAERDLLQNKRNAKPNAWLFFLPKAKKSRSKANFAPTWCRRPGSNRHGCRHPRDFKSRASANFATPATACFIVSAPLHKVKDEPPPSLSRGAGRWPKALPAFLPIKIPLQQRPAANLPFEDEPSSLSGPSKAFASRALFSFLRQGALFSVKKRSSGKPKAALYQQKSLLHRPLLIPQNHMEAGVQKLLILFQRVYPP